MIAHMWQSRGDPDEEDTATRKMRDLVSAVRSWLCVPTDAGGEQAPHEILALGLMELEREHQLLISQRLLAFAGLDHTRLGADTAMCSGGDQVKCICVSGTHQPGGDAIALDFTRIGERLRRHLLGR